MLSAVADGVAAWQRHLVPSGPRLAVAVPLPSVDALYAVELGSVREAELQPLVRSDGSLTDGAVTRADYSALASPLRS